jgi:cell division protein FtsN
MTRVEPSSVTTDTSTNPDDLQAVSANGLNTQDPSATNKADSPQLDSSEPAQATTNTTVTLSKAPPKPVRPQTPRSRSSSTVETTQPKTVQPKTVPNQNTFSNPTKPTSTARVAPSKPTVTTPSRSVYLRSYRVAVGSFSAPARAESLASSLRNEGLPARAIRSGGKTVVIVGPYKSESQAQAAFDQVKTSHNDAILFRPNGSKIRANAGAQSTPGSVSPAESNPVGTTGPDTQNTTNIDTSPDTLPEATSSTPVQSNDLVVSPVSPNPDKAQTTPQSTQAKPLGRYLQVGAFKDISSAGPMLSRLAKYGYRGTLDQGSDGLTRVLVGPYDTNTFEKAKRNLRNRGFKVFAAK